VLSSYCSFSLLMTSLCPSTSWRSLMSSSFMMAFSAKNCSFSSVMARFSLDISFFSWMISSYNLFRVMYSASLWESYSFKFWMASLSASMMSSYYAIFMLRSWICWVSKVDYFYFYY
jgi:hypothetical protein